MKTLKNKKIAVIGIGGVGGYVAALLAEHYDNVSFVARGGRGESIKKNGLVLHSDFRGEIVAHPMKIVESAKELEPQDYVFICVKNYSLDEIGADLKECVSENTVIVPIMNGADPGEHTRQLLQKGTVLDSLIYIVAFANSDYSVSQQGDFQTIWIGRKDADELIKGKIEDTSVLLNEAGIECKIAPDIDRAIWKKYIMNCAYNVETAVYDNTIGELRADEKKTKEYMDLVMEAYAVAKAKGIGVTNEDVDAIIQRFREVLADNATSSLQRDVEAGRKTEVETFSGYLVKEAKRLGLLVPVTEEMYHRLLQICK